MVSISVLDISHVTRKGTNIKAVESTELSIMQYNKTVIGKHFENCN
jgi:hypothetical protein